MFDVITLTLQTDSTRVISDMPRMDNRDGTGAWESEGNPYVYHTMTHHGEDAGKLRWFTQSDILYMQEWAYFLDKLKSVREGEGTLLDNCMVVWGATGGSVNAHNNHHLPAILCGGKGLGVQHLGHLVEEDEYLGNVWQTTFHVMNVPVPERLAGGRAQRTPPETPMRTRARLVGDDHSQEPGPCESGLAALWTGAKFQFQNSFTWGTNSQGSVLGRSAKTGRTGSGESA